MPEPREPANVFSIPTGAPFLATLADALFDGTLIGGFDAADPLALADLTLYLPTRRAARAVRENFLTRSRGRATLLPRIRTLGDIDEDEVELEGDELPAAVPGMERQLVLTNLVLGWSGALVRAAAELPEEELIVPASPADAARLAGSLAALMDQVGTTQEAWRRLFVHGPAEHARYWEITLEFLRIATEFWPKHLQERGLIDPGTRRDLAIRAEALRLRTKGSAAPVVAAGSTGSIPATAELLAAISRLPNGAVVLPGLDQSLDEEGWAAIGTGVDEPAGAGHPQYGLKALLQRLGVGRRDVRELAEPDDALRERARFVSEALRPASTTERWSTHPALAVVGKRHAVARIGLVEAANEREEALAVALLLREAIAEGEGTAALVTPDRGLARRVAVELRRWNVDVDDSAGRPLGRTPAGTFARLVAEVAVNGAEAESLLALLKHRSADFGMPPEERRSAARNLERAALRGPRLRPGLAALRHAIAIRRASMFDGDDDSESPVFTQASRYLSKLRWDEADAFAAKVEAALLPLETLAGSRRVAFSSLVAAHLEALRTASADVAGRPAVFAEEGGEELAAALEAMAESAAHGPEISPQDYPSLFAALIERTAVRRRGQGHPRVQIWGALEARLQRVDRIVLGGLNEGTWPARTRLDPLLSRPMRAALDLEPPERRIGLAAHDFAQALGHPDVWLTRANRQDGEPRVASRWLQRLTAYAGPDLTEEMRARGRKVVALARRLDRPAEVDRPMRPRPSPPVRLRPKRLSATRIETLIRDPYAIHAQYVLGLKPFEPIAKLPDARERGTLFHDVLERFIGERPRGPFDRAALDRLREIGRETFGGFADFPEIEALWWPRFEIVARWFVAAEADRADIVERQVEATGELAVTSGFTLTARADRIDRLADGRLAIVDYKTGTPPALKEVHLLSPQLPLEALIAARGGFEGIEAGEPARLEYFHLSGRGAGGVIEDRSAPKGKTLEQALVDTEGRLAALVGAFAEEGARYLSRKIPRRGRVFVGDYDHLARVAEWTTTDEEDDQGIGLAP